MVKEKLQRHFGEKITVAGLPGKDTIITLTDTLQTILTEQFYTEKCETIYQEKLRIVKEAAEMIREDIKRQVYNVEKYPSFDENMRDECKQFPMTMQQLPAPQELLSLIFCKCRNGCQKKCVCSQVGRCSSMCLHCHGINCKYACILDEDQLND